MHNDRSRFRRVACGSAIAFAAIALSSPTVAAQDSALVDGAHIRIQSADERQAREGTFHALTPDSLSYSPGLDTSIVTIALARVNKVEVSRERGGAGSVFKGAAIGAGLGLGAIAAIAGGCKVAKDDACGLGLVWLSPIAIGTGFLVGALVGSQARGNRWWRVYPPERRASLLIGPTSRGGIVVGLSVPIDAAPAR